MVVTRGLWCDFVRVVEVADSVTSITLCATRLHMLDDSTNRSERHLAVVTLALVQTVLLGACTSTIGQSGGSGGTGPIANPAESLRVGNEGIGAECSSLEVLKVFTGTIVLTVSSIIIVVVTIGSAEVEGSSW